MMRRFGCLMIGIFCASILFSCNSHKKYNTPFVIGQHHKKVTQETVSKRRISAPPAPPMNYYPYVNILLTDSECFVHYDNTRRYPSCGTGVDYSYVRRINLGENQIHILMNIDSSLSAITSKSPDKLIIDIASEKDTIKNPVFNELIQSLGKQGFNLIRVRNFTEEEKCVLDQKIHQIPCNIDSLDWGKRPKIDALFDLDEDGEFEIQESLN